MDGQKGEKGAKGEVGLTGDRGEKGVNGTDGDPVSTTRLHICTLTEAQLLPAKYFPCNIFIALCLYRVLMVVLVCLVPEGIWERREIRVIREILVFQEEPANLESPVSLAGMVTQEIWEIKEKKDTPGKVD